MTTIAIDVKNRVVAFDSRMTQGSVIVSDKLNKMKVINGDKWIISGFPDEIHPLSDIYYGNSEVKDVRSLAVLLTSGGDLKTVMVEDGELIVQSEPFSIAYGSGKQFAISALDHGKTAKEAVKYASSKDCYTGGMIREVNY